MGNDRLFLRRDKTVVAVAARVDHTGVAGLGIGKHEEFMPEKVHLKDGFLHRHGLQLETLVADNKLPICIMHNRDNTDYNDFMTDVIMDLKESVDIATAAGIDRGKIILDPGVGFAKDLEQNIIVMKELDRLNELNLPILLGTSRKSVIGLTLDLPKDERVEGTLVTTVLAVIKGCMFVRVHDVKENVRTIKMAEALFK